MAPLGAAAAAVVKTAVISGGAGGLGRALAAALQARGWRCLLLDRDVAGLEQTAQQVAIPGDLTDPDQLAVAVATTRRLSPQIDLVIHAAGITHIGPFESLPDATLRRLFEVNFFAATALTGALLEPVRRARGTHLAISSVAGFSPLYHRTAYSASKHAIEGFFGSLRSEERAHGVDVLIAAPSFVATNSDRPVAVDGTSRPGSSTDGIDAMTPEAAARAILRGYDRRQPMIPVGRVAHLAWRIHRLSPRLFQRLMERKIGGH